MTDQQHLITAIIPFLGTADQVDVDKWLPIAVRSLPEGMPYIVATNQGKHEMASSLNLALQNVTTEFTFVMAADDYCEPDMVDKLFSALGTADIAYPTMRLFSGRKTLHLFVADLPSMWRLQDENLCGIFLARTEALREVGGWTDELLEDWDLMYRLSRAGKHFVPVPHATYHYRIHKKSLSHRIHEESEKLGVEVYACPGSMDPTTRVPMLATFYAQSTAGISYVRSELPARYLPGVARKTVDLGNKHDTKMAVFEYPADHPLLRQVRGLGRAVVVNVDDDYLTPSLCKMILASSIPGKKHLAEAWKRDQPGHRKCVQMADAVVAATAELAMTYSVLNKNVHLIPNMVDPDDWPEMHPMRLDGRLRIVWPAGQQHLPDAPLIEPAMRWASQQPNVEVMCLGLDPGWDFEYHHEPSTPSVQVYRDLLSLADIVVAPVVPSAFNRAKSDIKWLEAAMVGAAFVGSKVPAYDTVWHESTGILARGRRDFERYIKDLVHDEDMRLELGKKAAERVMDTRHAKFLRIPYLQLMATCGLGTFEFEEEDAA